MSLQSQFPQPLGWGWSVSHLPTYIRGPVSGFYQGQSLHFDTNFSSQVSLMFNFSDWLNIVLKIKLLLTSRFRVAGAGGKVAR